MGKIIATLLLSFLLIGCGTAPVKLRTEVVEVYKPILYCPAPNWEGLDRPDPLAIDGIDETTSPGEIAKRYKATIKQLEDYADRLHRSLERYDSTHQAYEELRLHFLEQQSRDGFIEEQPRALPAPPPPPEEPASIPPEPEKEVSAPEVPPEEWVVQVGSFSNQTRAFALFDRLQTAGFDTFIDSSATKHRVRIGPFPDRATALQTKAKLAADLKIRDVLVVERQESTKE